MISKTYDPLNPPFIIIDGETVCIRCAQEQFDDDTLAEASWVLSDDELALANPRCAVCDDLCNPWSSFAGDSV